MRKNFKAVAARNSDQRDARGLRRTDGERRWRRHRHQYRQADGRRLLDHLDRQSAAHHAETALRIFSCARQRAGEFIKRIVTADVLTQRDEAAPGLEKAAA